MPLHDNERIICPLHCSLYAQIPISPVHDLILGKIEGARAPDEPDRSWKAVKQEVHAVETRSQKEKKNRPYIPLK